MTVKTKQLNKTILVEIVKKDDDPKLDRLYQALLTVISENDLLELVKNEEDKN